MDRDHRCACWRCDPWTFPQPATRQGEHHASVRFGDYSTGAVTYHLIDAEGNDIANDVVEFFGDRGVVYAVRRIAGATHECRCGQWRCMVRLTGAFRLIREVAAPTA